MTKKTIRFQYNPNLDETTFNKLKALQAYKSVRPKDLITLLVNYYLESKQINL